jgi:hypothetical protein
LTAKDSLQTNFFSTSKTLFWRDVQKIDIQLFALVFQLTNGKKTTFCLNPIDSDEDVKAKKEKVGSIATIQGDAASTQLELKRQ